MMRRLFWLLVTALNALAALWIVRGLVRSLTIALGYVALVSLYAVAVRAEEPCASGIRICGGDSSGEECACLVETPETYCELRCVESTPDCNQCVCEGSVCSCTTMYCPTTPTCLKRVEFCGTVKP